jgi:hypothetical protein
VQVEEMVNMAAIAVIDAQEKGKKSKFNLVLNVVNYKLNLINGHNHVVILLYLEDIYKN